MDKPYSYVIPPQYSVTPGMRVVVPLGRGNRMTEGMILSVSDGNGENLKSVAQVLDAEPLLSERELRLAAFVRRRYFCTFYDAIRAMLPAGVWYQTKVLYEITELSADYESIIVRQPMAMQLMAYILPLQQAEEQTLHRDFPDDEALQKALRYLVKKGLLRCSENRSKTARDKTEKMVSLIVSAEEAEKYAQRKSRSAPLQRDVLQVLCAAGTVSSKELCYFTGATMATIKRLETLGYVRLSEHEVFRTPLPQEVAPAAPIVLNAEQSQVFEALSSQMAKPSPGAALLHGVTGSGKTSVYIRLIQQVLQQKKQAVLLVPEIALTPQLLSLLMSHFGREVAVLHSGLRMTERYDEWKRIRRGLAHVVVGTRSAVFAPVPNLGLLILDEEQEHTYKSENSPRYHAREIALYRGSKEQALVLFGSATPSVDTMYRAQQGVYSYLSLHHRFNGMDLPTAELVDLRQELLRGNSGSISMPLREAMEETFSAGKQCILFLNRRGAGKYVVCVDCGNVPTCPRCSVHLTYHTANGRLMCHHCGHSEPLQASCTDCGGHYKVVGSGTQKVEQELAQLFPDRAVLRMDADTISAAHNHETILQTFQNDRIPILLGTQMVAKGLNFENVTLVGVLDADSSLYSGSYRASETTFSLISQVVGRSGRGSSKGRAIIQTMNPEHTVLQLAARQDYLQFYELELPLRQLQNSPPFCDLFTLSFVGPFEDRTVQAAYRFRQMLEYQLHQPDYAALHPVILGPAPAPIVKINNTYRYQLTLHCVNLAAIRDLLSSLLRSFAGMKEHRGVSAFADINAYE